MKKNFPVTQQEVRLPVGHYIVSRTDLKGSLTYVNDTFADISGFDRSELIGFNHNVVRHPDMPPQAFEQLWKTVKAGLPWRGMVKNRCKNGDHYWVHALIVPVRKGDQTIGYMSVRSEPDRAELQRTEALYKELNETKHPLPADTRAGPSLQLRLIGLTLFILAMQFVSDGLEFLGGGGWIRHVLSLFGIFGTALLIYWQRQTLLGIEDVTRLMDRIAQGSLCDEIPSKKNDELGRMYNAMAAMQAHLKVMLAEINEASVRIRQDSESLKNGMSTIYDKSAHQSESVSHIVANVEKLNHSAKEAAAGAEETANVVQESRDVLLEVVGRMEKSRHASKKVEETVKNAGNTIKNLSEAVAQIAKVSDSIKEIADQTNLLALNAAIEAARAGEAGRGFAVVADEVRKLAERAATQTGEISHTVEGIQNVTKEALLATGCAETQVGEVEKAILYSDQGVSQVAEKEKVVDEMSQHIAQAVAEESIAIEDISAHLEHILESAEGNKNHLGEAREQIAKLVGVADILNAQVSYFRFV